MPEVDDASRIEASPTKDFFVYMLTKDIELTRAIIDLVDNSVDGAIKLRPDGMYEGLWVRIEATKDYFRISDNCGGIDVDVARHYAFRFGRPPGFVAPEHSIGEFGVGMKRALFKLGTEFKIESTTPTDRFEIEVNVASWKKKGDKDWDFKFKKLEHVGSPQESCGTTVTVSPLHEGVSKQFSLENFQTKLSREIAAAHILRTTAGLAISLNAVPVGFEPLRLLSSEELKPAYKEVRIEGEKPILVKIYCGVSRSDPNEAGWYIFCNARMVLGADKTAATGWGEGEETKIPRYHNQYATFRGYAFFDAASTEALPWNTTKSGVDLDSPVYQAMRLEMVGLMRPVIDFLNDLKGEKDLGDEEASPLAAAIAEAEMATVEQIRDEAAFSAPQPAEREPPPRQLRITYLRPEEQVEKAIVALSAQSRKEVGERTFDYFFEREVED